MDKKAYIVKTCENAVVKMYMEILRKGFENAGYNAVNFHSNCKIFKKDIIITDTVNKALPYILRRNKNLCIWFQGIVPEESYMRNRSKLRYSVLSWMEKVCLKKAKLVFFVSKEMKRFYEKKYKINLDAKSIIMPCFNEQKVENDAFGEDKYNKNTFVYLGGLQKWQCFEQTAKVYAEIEKKAQTPTKFYVFTSAKEKAISILNKYGAKNYEVDFVSPEELSARIKNIKYGFVLREDISVNNVATPTKFSNYISNGIIPIYSSCISSFAEYDSDLKLGVTCDLENIDDGVNNILHHMQESIVAEEIKNKCEKVFDDYYNQDAYIAKIIEKINSTDFR